MRHHQGMIIVEERMIHEVIANPICEYLEKMSVCYCCYMHVSIGKVGVAGRFDPLSRDSSVP